MSLDSNCRPDLNMTAFGSSEHAGSNRCARSTAAPSGNALIGSLEKDHSHWFRQMARGLTIIDAPMPGQN
jgi:hypothetical protein